MKRATALLTTVGAFGAAGVAATVLKDRQRAERRKRRGEDVEFGTVRGEEHTVVAADGTAIHVEVDEHEGGDLTVVFVHGWMCDLDTWHYQRLALRGRVRMVLMDHRGHGRSGRTHADNSALPLLADDLARVIEAHAPSGRLLLVGHSMGGMTIMQLAADRPGIVADRVAGVALIGTSAGKLVRSSPALMRLGPVLRRVGPVADWGRGFNSYSVMRRWAVGPHAQERHADMTDEMIRRTPSRVLVDFYPNFLTLDLFGALETLADVDTVVIGGTDDMLTPLKHSRRLAGAIDGARLVIVPGAGHMVMFESHVTVTQALLDQLDRVT